MSYWRADKEVVAEMHGVNRGVTSIVESIEKGNDLDMASLNSVIARLEMLRDTAKKFEDTDSVDKTRY